MPYIILQEEITPSKYCMDDGIVGKNQAQNDLQSLNKHLAPSYHKFQKRFANIYI